MSGAFEKYGLTIHEACTYSGIGKTKLYEAIASGKLKAHKAGKRTLILSDDLRDYLSSLPLMVRAAVRFVVIVGATLPPLADVGRGLSGEDTTI